MPKNKFWEDPISLTLVVTLVVAVILFGSSLEKDALYPRIALDTDVLTITIVAVVCLTLLGIGFWDGILILLALIIMTVVGLGVVADFYPIPSWVPAALVIGATVLTLLLRWRRARLAKD